MRPAISPLLQVFTHSLLLHIVFVGKFVSREGRVQLHNEPYTLSLIYYGFCFSEQNWCEYFADWKDTPMNFCNKKMKYFWEGPYQIAQLDSKALTLIVQNSMNTRPTQVVEWHQS